MKKRRRVHCGRVESGIRVAAEEQSDNQYSPPSFPYFGRPRPPAENAPLSPSSSDVVHLRNVTQNGKMVSRVEARASNDLYRRAKTQKLQQRLSPI